MGVSAGMIMAFPEQLAVALRRKLQDAEAVYKAAKDEYRQLMSSSEDTSDLKDPALSDGNLALRRAIRLHRDARTKYQNALKEFTDFILHDKAPH